MGMAPVVSLDFYGLQNVLGGRDDNESAVNEDFMGLVQSTSSFMHTRKDFWTPTVDAVGASTELSMNFQRRDTQRSIAGSCSQPSLFTRRGKSDKSTEERSEELRDDQVYGKPSASSERTPLNKPLEELTEEDIKQLTREDCRRYLKEKGMRRPSWNKSQAIQQVLLLKGLIDSKGIGGKRTDHTQGVFAESIPAESLRMQQTFPTQSQQRAAVNEQQTLSSHAQGLQSSMLQVFPSHNMNSVFVEKLLEPYTNYSWSTGRQGCIDGRFQKTNQMCQSSQLASGAEGVTSMNVLRGHGSTLPSFTRPSGSLPASSFPSDSVAPMVNQQQLKGGPPGIGATQQASTLGSCTPNAIEKPLKAQLTIFYSGMVNVYDDVSADKAQAIMRLAGSGTSLPLPVSPFGPVTLNASFSAASSTPAACLAALPAAYHLNHATGSVASTLSSGILSGAKQQTTTVMQPEAPPYRKACLQRFLEKRKDRFRSKVAPYTNSKKPSSFAFPHLYGAPIEVCERSTSIPTVPLLLPPLVPGQRPTQSSGSETSSLTKPPETPQQASSDDQGTSVENRTSDSQI
eukprot:c27104_g1_i1 orf=901-2610(-)